MSDDIRLRLIDRRLFINACYELGLIFDDGQWYFDTCQTGNDATAEVRRLLNLGWIPDSLPTHDDSYVVLRPPPATDNGEEQVEILPPKTRSGMVAWHYAAFNRLGRCLHRGTIYNATEAPGRVGTEQLLRKDLEDVWPPGVQELIVVAGMRSEHPALFHLRPIPG